MTQAEYETRESKLLANQLADVERAPLHERREAMADYADMMTRPDIIGERIGWLLAGNYGYGAMVKAKDIASRPRMNRVAGLSQLLAALDHRCPAAFARKAYNAMSKEQREAVDMAILAAIHNELIAAEA